MPNRQTLTMVPPVNAKTVIIVLCLLSLGLAAGLWVRHTKALAEHARFEKSVDYLSNQWNQTSADLREQRVVNTDLMTKVAQRTEEVARFSNQLDQTAATLAKTEADAKAAADQAREEMAKRDAKIASLEAERDDLTKRMTELNVSITSLETKIADTERKLAASEGDREFLLKELKRLQAEKAELERQFNDLAVLREQVRKLRDELSIAKRIDMIRRGIYGQDLKGAQRMQQMGLVPAPKTNFNLNVELKSDGGVNILPPDTNAPPAK